MSGNFILLGAIIFIIALGGGLYYYKYSFQSPEALEPEKQPNANHSVSDEAFPPLDFTGDELGLMNISRNLITGLAQIVKEEGTENDVINLVNSIEIQLNKTIENVELSEDQLSTLYALFDSLDKAEELAKDGVSPAQILEEMQPEKPS